MPQLPAPLVLSVGACIDVPNAGCAVLILHTLVPGADDYVIDGSGNWVGGCDTVLPGLGSCSIRFPQGPPDQICDFTVRAVRDGVEGLPSQQFCVPGVIFG